MTDPRLVKRKSLNAVVTVEGYPATSCTFFDHSIFSQVHFQWRAMRPVHATLLVTMSVCPSVVNLHILSLKYIKRTFKLKKTVFDFSWLVSINKFQSIRFFRFVRHAIFGDWPSFTLNTFTISIISKTMAEGFDFWKPELKLPVPVGFFQQQDK